MQCPNCKIEMEKGIILNGIHWIPANQWRARLIGGTGERVYAFRCPKCGRVELTTEVKP